jgi:hypothetical protein
VSQQHSLCSAQIAKLPTLPTTLLPAPARAASPAPACQADSRTSEDAFHEHAELRANVLADCPVGRNVFPDGPDQLSGDHPEVLIAQHLHGAIVRLQRIVEGELLFIEAQLSQPEA